MSKHSIRAGKATSFHDVPPQDQVCSPLFLKSQRRLAGKLACMFWSTSTERHIAQHFGSTNESPIRRLTPLASLNQSLRTSRCNTTAQECICITACMLFSAQLIGTNEVDLPKKAKEKTIDLETSLGRPHLGNCPLAPTRRVHLDLEIIHALTRSQELLTAQATITLK